MIISIYNPVASSLFALNDPNSSIAVYLDEPIDGLTLPPVRTSSGNYSGRDGGYIGAQFDGMRLITLTGRIFSQTAAGLETARKALAAAVPKGVPLQLLITTDGGSLYLIYCYYDNLLMPINRTKSKAPFNLSLIAPDPNIYDNSAGGLNSATVPLSLGGGITWPITWPIVWNGGALPTTINNSGTVALYPLITLTNQMTNPMITNTTTGQFFFLQGLTTTAGDVLVIDMKNHTVLLNGGSVLPYVTLPSTWWPLITGNNTIKLSSGNSGDTVTALVQWRSAVRGI